MGVFPPLKENILECVSSLVLTAVTWEVLFDFCIEYLIDVFYDAFLVSFKEWVEITGLSLAYTYNRRPFL